MAATMQIVERHGPTATPADTQKDSSTVRFKNADNATVDNANPMVVPTAGQDYSYEKWLALKVTAGTYTLLDNPKFYTDGAKGWAAQVKLWAKKVAAYATPTEPASTAGFTDAFTYTAGTPLTLGAATKTTGTGIFGSHAVLMLEVETGASQGALAGETATFAWDEI